jgi:hypothetical protein
MVRVLKVTRSILQENWIGIDNRTAVEENGDSSITSKEYLVLIQMR